MSELKPLPITDNRTPEQVRADGDERWPDGSPYIKDGVCCVCGKNVVQEAEKYPVHMCLVRMSEPGRCEIVHEMDEESARRCTGIAYWSTVDVSLCDECITDMLEKLPDNRAWLEPALADIRARHLKIGARVRIQCIAERGQLGTVYRAWHDQSSWYVRVDRRPADNPGIVCMPDELDVLL